MDIVRLGQEHSTYDRLSSL